MGVSGNGEIGSRRRRGRVTEVPSIKGKPGTYMPIDIVDGCRRARGEPLPPVRRPEQIEPKGDIDEDARSRGA
jgi:hypothetical protein